MCQKATILIVDTHNDEVMALKQMFNDDFIVLEAHDISDVLEAVAGNEGIDMILLDMDMTVDGKDLLETRRDNAGLSSIPVMVVSSEDEADVQAVVADCDVEDYILRPLVKDVVLKRVNHVLDSRRMMGRMIDGYRDNNIAAVKNFKQDVENYKEEITDICDK